MNLLRLCKYKRVAPTMDDMQINIMIRITNFTPENDEKSFSVTAGDNRSGIMVAINK